MKQKSQNSNARQYLTIGEVSDLYGISTPTLRYLEAEGVCKSRRNKENNYRIYDIFETLIDFGDAIFYRNLGIPYREIKKIYAMNIDELESFLDNEKGVLYNQIDEISRKIEYIKARLELLNELKNTDYELRPADIPFSRAVRFDYNNREHFKKYIDNPNRFVAINRLSKGMLYDINGIADDDFDGEVIFEKRPDCIYLMSYCYNPMNSTDYFPFDRFRSRLKELGADDANYVLQFLVNMVNENNVRCDYYRVWFIIEPDTLSPLGRRKLAEQNNK